MTNQVSEILQKLYGYGWWDGNKGIGGEANGRLADVTGDAAQALLDHLKAQLESQKQQLLSDIHPEGRISNKELNEAITIANKEVDRFIAMLERELGGQ